MTGRDDAEADRLRVSVLGPTTAQRGDQALDLGPPKHRALLAALAMAEGRPVGIDAIASLVWPADQVPADPAGGVQVYVSGLRRALAAPAAVVTSAGGYALDRGHATVDATEVTDVATTARRVLHEAALMTVPVATASPAEVEALLDRIETALARWRGEPFLDLTDTPAVLAARARLDGVRVSLLEHRALAQLVLGRHGDAADQLGGLVVEHELHERLWCLYAVALARSERQAEALEALRTVRLRLVEDLGVDPGPGLRELEGMLLRQDDALRLPRAMTEVTPAVPEPVTRASPPPSTLVGRDREVRLLGEQLEVAGMRVIQLVGEAGIGKSTLVEAARASAEAAGELVVVARCPEDEGAPPLWPWAEAISALVQHEVLEAADLPDGVQRLMGAELPTPSAEAPVDAETARFRLFQEVERVLRTAAGRRRFVLVLEDLHWADSATARLVAHLLSSWSVAAEQPDVLLLLTRRGGEADGARPALDLALDALARHGTLRLDLAGLTADDVVALARRRTSWEPDPAAAATLLARSSGKPLPAGRAPAAGTGSSPRGSGPGRGARRRAATTQDAASGHPRDPLHRVRRGSRVRARRRRASSLGP